MRKLIRTECKYILPSEVEEVPIGNWTAELHGKVHEGVIRNLDLLGLFVECAKPVKLNEKVTVQFNLKGIEKKVQVRGETVWSNEFGTDWPRGFAIKFIDININLEVLNKAIRKIKEHEKKDSNLVNIPETPSLK
jgi:Tfp pilus assembly protein PilZ